MVFNRFNIWIFSQILLIALVSLLIALTIDKEFVQVTRIGLILLWAGQIIYLYFYLNRMHRDIYRFIDAFRNQDSSLLFKSSNKRGYIRKFYELFNEISLNFRLIRIEKEVESRFYKEVIGRSTSGIIAIKESGEIRLINNAALRIVGSGAIHNLEELKALQPQLAIFLAANKSGKHDAVKIQTDNKVIEVAITSSEITLESERIRIFNLQDISREMARSEVEAWQKLIRVLNHEITNSVSPIHMLSASLIDMYNAGDNQISENDIDDQFIDNQLLGLRTIMKRSRGLVEFIDSYRTFTKSVSIEFNKVSIADIFKTVLSLLNDELDRAGVEVRIDISSPKLSVLADEKLVEQTLINLVKNSIVALKGIDNPRIGLIARKQKKQVVIEINDNGKGVPEEIIGNIFTPFFTTRKEGSGIGLSLARQVMNMHNGTITVSSESGQNTCFALTF